MQLTNAVFSALPTFFMCTFKLPKTVLKQIDKFRKYCLWRGANLNAKSPPKAAWHMVCLPKSEEGLGVINLLTQNEALLLKNLHKFFNRLDIPWVHLIWEKHFQNDKLPNNIGKGSFWWRDNIKLLDKFKGIASVNLSDGRTCSLWWDIWEGQVCAQIYPELFSFAKIKHLSLQKVLSITSIEQLFHLPLSSEAYSQLLLLCDKLDGLHLNSDQDIWTYIWGSPLFSSSRAYKHLTGYTTVPSTYMWLWKNCCQHKHKVFFLAPPKRQIKY